MYIVQASSILDLERVHMRTGVNTISHTYVDHNWRPSLSLVLMNVYHIYGICDVHIF